MKKFKDEKELVNWIETMHLQNTNGRETEDEMFRLGIEAAIDELSDLKLFSLPDVNDLVGFSFTPDKMHNPYTVLGVVDRWCVVTHPIYEATKHKTPSLLPIKFVMEHYRKTN